MKKFNTHFMDPRAMHWRYASVNYVGPGRTIEGFVASNDVLNATTTTDISKSTADGGMTTVMVPSEVLRDREAQMSTSLADGGMTTVMVPTEGIRDLMKTTIGSDGPSTVFHGSSMPIPGQSVMDTGITTRPAIVSMPSQTVWDQEMPIQTAVVKDGRTEMPWDPSNINASTVVIDRSTGLPVEEGEVRAGPVNVSVARPEMPELVNKEVAAPGGGCLTAPPELVAHHRDVPSHPPKKMGLLPGQSITITASYPYLNKTESCPPNGSSIIEGMATTNTDKDVFTYIYDYLLRMVLIAAFVLAVFALYKVIVMVISGGKQSGGDCCGASL